MFKEVRVTDTFVLPAFAFGLWFAVIGPDRFSFKWDIQKAAHLLHDVCRVDDHVFIAHALASFGGNSAEEIQNVAVGDSPDLFGQGEWILSSGLHQVGKQDFKPVPDTGLNHGIGVPHQVNIFRLIKDFFGPFEHRHAGSIGRRFIYQKPGRNLVGQHPV